MEKIENWVKAAIVLAMLCAASPVFAVGLYPTHVSAGNLSLGENNFSFTVTNLYKYNSSINVSFEITQPDTLRQFVYFIPANITMENDTDRYSFDVVIPVGAIPIGDYLLIFRPVVRTSGMVNPDNSNVGVGGIIVPTAAASINFSVNATTTTTTTTLPAANVPEEERRSSVIEEPHVFNYKELTIEVPWVIEATEPVTNITLNIRNTGNASLENLSLLVESRQNMSLDYNRLIGRVDPGNQTAVTVFISDLVESYSLVNITIYSAGTNWTAGFLIYKP
jgi:hypothetical protein